MKKAVLAALVLFSFQAYAQKVNGKLQFQKGQTYEILTTVKSASEVMGQSVDVNLTSTRVLNVSDVANGSATMASKIKRLQVAFDGMGQNQSFDSEKEADRNSDMGKSFEKNLKNTYTMTVDAYGKITAVKEDSARATTADAAAAPDMMGGMMGGMMQGFGVPKTGERTDFAILPAKELSKGDTWTDTASASSDVKRNAAYTVTDITGSEILVDYTEEVSEKKTGENMGMEMTIDKKDKNTGKVVLDRKTGLLKQQTVTTVTSGTVSVMGQDVPLDVKSTQTVVVTPGK